MVGSLKLLNPAGKGSPPLSVKTTFPGSLSQLLYVSRHTVWEIAKTCICAALVSKSETCGRPKVGTFHKPRRVCQHWLGVPASWQIINLLQKIHKTRLFLQVHQFLLLMKEMQLLMSESFDAVICLEIQSVIGSRPFIVLISLTLIACLQATAQRPVHSVTNKEIPAEKNGFLNLNLCGFG